MNGLKTTSGLALLACLLTLSVVAEASESKPNIILIMTDDQGYDDYGFRQAPKEDAEHGQDGDERRAL